MVRTSPPGSSHLHNGFSQHLSFGASARRRQVFLLSQVHTLSTSLAFSGTPWNGFGILRAVC